jgi:hypothetical protein
MKRKYSTHAILLLPICYESENELEIMARKNIGYFFCYSAISFFCHFVINGFVLLGFRLVAPRRDKLGQLNQC